MQAEIIQLTLRQLLTRGKLLALLGVVMLPPFMAVLYTASGATIAPERFAARLYDGLVLTTVLPLLALIFGGAALGNEVEDGTLIYLVMKPVARSKVVAAKLLTTVVVVAAFAVLSVLLTAIITGRDAATLQVGVAFAAAAAGGALAYTAAFLLLGLVTSRTLIVGLLYVFLWEGALTGLFRGLRALSIRQYARSLAEPLAGLPDSAFNATLSTRAAVIGVVAVTAVCFLLATRRLDVMDLE